MIFHADMIAAILDGRKTRTTRPAKLPKDSGFYVPCRYRAGHDYAVQAGRGKHAVARIRVIAVTSYASVEDVPMRFLYARREGFTSWYNFMVHWWRLYDGDDARLLGPVWVIDFALVQPASGGGDANHSVGNMASASAL